MISKSIRIHSSLNHSIFIFFHLGAHFQIEKSILYVSKELNVKCINQFISKEPISFSSIKILELAFNVSKSFSELFNLCTSSSTVIKPSVS
ncbi:hypothetical protein HOG21_06425 [bacterium]|nr:hypothetical protein [bacterium]